MLETSIIVRVEGDAWTLHNPKLTEGYIKIDWASISSSRGKLTKPLIEEGKLFLLEAIKRLEAQRGGISASALLLKFHRIRFSLEWMIQNSVSSFSLLTPLHIDKLLQAAAQRPGFQLTNKTMTSWHHLFVEAWLTRGPNWGGLSFDPRTYRRLNKWTKVGKRNRRWKPLEEQAAISLIKDAITWMETVAPLLPPLLRKIYASRAETQHLSRKRFRMETYKFMQNLENSEEFKKLRSLLGNPDIPSAFLIHKAIRLTQGATLAQILFLCGTRVSEAASLTPNCLTSATHSDGFDYSYIQGWLAKTNGRDHRWIAPPSVCTAIEKINKLFDFIDAECRPSLFIAMRGNGILNRKMQFDKYRALRASAVVKEFARTSLRASPIPGHIRFHCHQGRKTFARFVVSRDRNALGALAGQYGHAHSGITDQAYVGYDIELSTLLSEAEQEELTLRLSELLSASSIGGKAGKNLRTLAETQLRPTQFRGKRALKHMAESLIAKGVKLAPCDWGYCIYVQELSACQGSHTGPNEIRRAPDVCAKCRNFAVTERHRPWWEERFNRDTAFLKGGNISEQAERFVERRIQTTTEVLIQIQDIKRPMQYESDRES